MKIILNTLFAITILFSIGCTDAVEQSKRRDQENLESTNAAMEYLFKAAWREYVLEMKEGSEEEKEIARKSLLDVPDAKLRIAEIASDPDAKPEEKELAKGLLEGESLPE